MATQSQPTVDDMDAQFGTAQPKNLIPTQTEQPSQITIDGMDAQFSPEAMASEGALLAGARNGAMRLVDKPAEKLGDLMARAGISSAIRNKLIANGVSSKTANQLFPEAGQSAANDAANNAAFDKAYGSNPTAKLGQVAGQAAVIAPAIESGGALLGRGVGLASDALADVAPIASKTIQGASRLIGGTAGEGMPGIAGTATRGASTVAHGAAVGGAAAALSGQPVGQGVEYGALLGPAGAVLGKALSVGGNIARNALSPITDLSPSATQAAAVNKLVSALRADGLSNEQAIAQVQRLGPQGMLADVGGANVRNAAETVANSPGEGSNLAQQALESRAGTQAGRVNQAVKEATGATGNIHAEADQLIAQRAQEAAPLYEIAMDPSHDIVYSSKAAVDPRLAQFAKDPIIQQGMHRGAEIARLQALAKGENFDPNQYLWHVTPEVPATYVEGSSSTFAGQGRPAGILTPGSPQQTTASFRALDAAKQGLDDILEQYRDPTTGRLNLDQRGRAINDVRAAFLEHLDSLNPDYAAARQAYAGPSQSLDAINMGKRALSADPEVTAKIVSNLSPGDKQFYLSGLTRALQDKIAGAQDGADITRKIFGNDLIRSKIAAAFDNPEAFAKFQQQMEAEAAFAQTRNQVLKGSQTARRLAGQADASQPFVDAGRHLLSGNAEGALSAGARGVANYLLQPSQAQSAALGKLLFTPGEEGATQLQTAIDALKPGPVKRALTNLLNGGRAAALPASTLSAQEVRH